MPKRRSLHHMADQDIINNFDKLYYETHSCFRKVQWCGTEIQKYPMDLILYQEILYRCRPELVIETGTYSSGSALYMAHVMDAIQQSSGSIYNGKIISIDIAHAAPPKQHSRITYQLVESSTDRKWLDKLQILLYGSKSIAVILDSDHHKDHVIAELNAYAPLVTSGQYLIVEDTNINGHPVLAGWGDGPMEALEEWKKTPMANDFYLDKGCEKLLLTANPNGYWRRK